MAKKRAPSKLKFEQLEPLLTATSTELLNSLGVAHTDWDILIIGDGSGAGRNSCCGWASVLIDQRSRLRKTFRGSMSAGTSYLAELIPYVQSLSWYADGPGKVLLHDKRGACPTARVNVHILTDNETLAHQGNGQVNRRKGMPYWLLLDGLAETGLALHWHWLKRNKTALNRMCDYLANVTRKSLDAVVQVRLPPGCSVYDFNAD